MGVPVIAVLTLVTGCSGADPGADPGSNSGDEPVPTVTAAEPTPTSTGEAAGDVEPAERTTAETPIRVDMTIVAESAGIQTDLSAGVDPMALDQADPFGTFASCSGVRRSFGPYSVLVAASTGDVSAVSVLTADSVSAAGIHDADIRIDLRSGEVLTASGTATIDAGWRSGSFVAFDPDGGRITGSFECSGGDPSGAPLDPSDQAGVLDSIEVFALLRRGDAERVVGLAVDANRSSEVTMECPAVDDRGTVVVGVDGDQTVGSLTSFELLDGEATTMRMSVGGVSYEFDDVVIALADPAVSGTFSATADGVAVDGAFRCI
jgi:hypothetical protein